jgi:CO/xanthine dehydrogenase FAD-binding subunit
LEGFVKGLFTIDLSPGEFVRELEIPDGEGKSSAFQKFALTSDDWAMINCGASLRLNDGRIRTPDWFSAEGWERSQ